MFYVTKLLKLFDIAKPRLAKVRALFYVLQQLIKRGCAYFDTASFFHWGCLQVENKRKKAVEKDYAVMLEAVEDYYTTKI